MGSSPFIPFSPNSGDLHCVSPGESVRPGLSEGESAHIGPTFNTNMATVKSVNAAETIILYLPGHQGVRNRVFTTSR